MPNENPVQTCFVSTAEDASDQRPPRSAADARLRLINVTGSRWPDARAALGDVAVRQHRLSQPSAGAFTKPRADQVPPFYGGPPKFKVVPSASTLSFVGSP